MISDSSKPSLLTAWLMALLGCLVLYVATAATEISWQDSGQFVQRVLTGELVPGLGLALSHPLHYWCGRMIYLTTGVEPARSLPWVSAIFGAITIANLLVIVRIIAGNWKIACFSAVSLAIAHTFWRMSTTAECYTLSTAMFSLELLLILRWIRTTRGRWLMLAMLVNGISLVNHNQALLDLPVLGILLIIASLRPRRRIGTLIGGCVLWVIGALPYIVMTIAHGQQTGDMAAAVRSALFGSAWQQSVLSLTPHARNLAVTTAFTLLSFPNLLIPLALLGIAPALRQIRSSTLHATLIGLLLIQVVFVARYNIQEQYTFMLPIYLLLAIYGGIGLRHVLQWKPSAVRKVIVAAAVLLLIATPVCYLFAVDVARSANALKSVARNKPYRDDYRYLLQPWGRDKDRSAAIAARQSLELAGNDGDILYEDDMISFALIYHRQLLHRNSIELIRINSGETPPPSTIRKNARVVLIPANRDHPAIVPPDGFNWQRDGDLYVLEHRTTE